MKRRRIFNIVLPNLTALLTVQAVCARAQSEVFLDSTDNTSMNTSSTANGLFWISTNGAAPVLMDQDFNVAIYAGTTTNLTLFATFLLSDGSAAGDNSYRAGTFLDPTCTSRTVSGADSGAFFQVQAWTGNYDSYAAAVAAGCCAGQSGVFSNAVVAPPGLPPSLRQMPAIVLAGQSGNGSSSSQTGLSAAPAPGTPSPGASSGVAKRVLPMGGGLPTGPTGLAGSNACSFSLSVTASNQYAFLTLSGTRQGQTYLVWSAEVADLPLTNWTLETSVVGSAGDMTQTNLATDARSNLFLYATESHDTNLAFQGMNYADFQVNIPDTMGAIGPDHFVELLNGGITVYDRGGAKLASTNIVGFFTNQWNGVGYPTGGQMTDPRILYDFSAGRWVASALEGGGSDQAFLAVSRTDDPTDLEAGWDRYVIPVSWDGWSSDFDTLGVDANGIYLAVLHFSSTNAGHTIAAIKKPEIYRGTNIVSFLTNTDFTMRIIQPAINYDNVTSNDYAWFVSKAPPTAGSNYQGGAIVYRRLEWSGTNTAWADTNWVAISAATDYQDYFDLDGTNWAVVNPPPVVSAPQPDGGSVNLAEVGSRLAWPVIINRSLWTCQCVGLDTTGSYAGGSSGATVTRSGPQWLRLAISQDGTSLSLADHGRVYDPAQNDNPWWYYSPSLSVNRAGDMAMGFSGSTATNYISAFYTWRLGCGFVLQPPVLLQTGVVKPGVPRWGDYSATALDPTDGFSVWTVQEYADTYLINGIDFKRWGTIVSRIKPHR